MTPSDPSSFDEPYDTVLEVVAQHPGSTVDELVDHANNHGVDTESVPELISQAVEQEDVVEFSDHYWVMRTGRYAFDAYDHPEP